MGKNLKGKECGAGIGQRKDGYYYARFCGKDGKRNEKYFSTLPEAKSWLADAKYEDRHSLIDTSSDITVDKWFTFWVENIICDLAPNTIRNYQERYKINIQPVLGEMLITDVKPMHCKAVLNRMEPIYAGSTIGQAYITMGTMLKSAVMNDVILKHPMNGVRYRKPKRAVDDVKFLTEEEQALFLEAAERSHNYRQYALLLETGLRTGELIGLTWDSINWKKRTLTISKSLEFRYGQQYWRAGPPKTKKSYRTIPLTQRAYEILKSCYDERHTRKESETLSQVLEYMDSRTGKKMFDYA
jgi:Site-specific recombinase XerD